MIRRGSGRCVSRSHGSRRPGRRRRELGGARIGARQRDRNWIPVFSMLQFDDQPVGDGHDQTPRKVGHHADPAAGVREPGKERGESVEVDEVDQQPEHPASAVRQRAAPALDEPGTQRGVPRREAEMDDERGHEHDRVEACLECPVAFCFASPTGAATREFRVSTCPCVAVRP